MAEKRKPDVVLWVRKGTRTSTKLEVFSSAQFANLSRFTFTLDPEQEQDLFRLRVNGVWFPAGRRFLYTRDQLMTLVGKELFS